MKTAVALGTFDGLHLGHRAVINAAKGDFVIAVTFISPPKLTLNSSGQLMTLEDRKEYLKELGVHKIICLDFNEVKDISPNDFLNTLKDKYKVDLISCGYNFRFGKNAAGDTEMLKDFCIKNGITYNIANPVMQNSEVISSSKIRELIKNGDIVSANKFLYSPYHFSSKVLSGDKRGRTIGFPTANLVLPKELIIPKCGVYKSRIFVNNKEYKAISNIGYRPTFKTESVVCETHIIDFSEDIYGETVTLYPEEFLREEKKFSSLEELKNAIKKDYAEVLK